MINYNKKRRRTILNGAERHNDMFWIVPDLVSTENMPGYGLQLVVKLRKETIMILQLHATVII